MNTTQLMLRCSLLAKDIAPKDSGNLAFNSIRAYKTPRGFRLVSLGNAALYNVFLEDGTKRSNKHQGWWSEKVYGAVETYLNTNLNTSMDSETYQRVAKQSKNERVNGQPTKRDKVFDRNIPSG